MENKNLEKRMYSLVMYNISPIQAGIQSAHSNTEYANEYGKDEDYIDWATKWRTVILLNGGTSNAGKESYYGYPAAKGSMERHLETLLNMEIKVVPFYEPDMNYALTSMSFIVDERVFNKELYPDPEITLNTWRDILSKKNISDALNYVFSNPTEEHMFNSWLKSIGGKEIFFLRLFLKNFSLANN